MKMEIQGESPILQRKSREILFLMKNYLEKGNQNIKKLICTKFGYQKSQFKKQQFKHIVRLVDRDLISGDIDDLFDQLDQSGNELVFLYSLEQALLSVTFQDNPQEINKKSIIKNIGNNNNDDAIFIYGQIRRLFLGSDYFFDILEIFDSEGEGYLSIQNIKQILNHFGFDDQRKQNVFIETITEGKARKISIDELITKLDLDLAKRMRHQKNQKTLEPSFNYINKSTFINNVEKQNDKNEEIFSLKKSLSSQQQIISIEKIPQQLAPYFNYGSQLESSFAFFSIQYITHNKTFIDHQNPPFSQAFQWAHVSQINHKYELFEVAKSILHRENNRKGLGLMLEPKDIKQGQLGDCYFLSAIAGVVEKYPQLIYRLFVLNKNPSHIFGIRLFIDGIWRTIILDGCFPMDQRNHFCGAQPHHSEIWVMLLEKAWAKVFNSYNNIVSGFTNEGLNAVTGAPSIHVSATQLGFVKRIEVQINRGSIISCSTSGYVSQMLKSEQQQWGIFSNHAYSLLHIYSNLPIKQYATVTLFKIRNPWGSKQWRGRWSFNDNLWTPILRNLVNYNVNSHDGTFFMCEDDFKVYFENVTISRINLANKNSSKEIFSDSYSFNLHKITIGEKQSGDYYLTIYQENPRKHKETKNYKKSKSWLFIAKNDPKTGISALGSSTTNHRDNNIEVTLEKGQYIIASKVKWKVWDTYNYCLTVYGPQKVRIQTCNMQKMNFISNFIESKAKLGFGKTNYYDNLNIMKRTHFSPEQGYGFIQIYNQEDTIFTIKITFQSSQGLVILPPYSLPLELNIFPMQEVICKFLVDPKGYTLNFKESYGIKNINSY